MNIHPQAKVAVHAAYLYRIKRIGSFAARRYAEKRGCPVDLLRLALILELSKPQGE